MFAVEIPVFAFYARLSAGTSRSRHGSALRQTATASDPRTLICSALAEMVPSTDAEIADATGLDLETVKHGLERLTAGYRVMFNPLTKRFSVPKGREPAFSPLEEKPAVTALGTALQPRR